MEELCITAALEIERTNDTVGTDDDPVLIIENIEQNVCPSQCSGNGQCQAGKCLCNEGTKNLIWIIVLDGAKFCETAKLFKIDLWNHKFIFISY